MLSHFGYSPKKTPLNRNPRSPVKNCPSVSFISLSESVRRGLILSGCDSYKLLNQSEHSNSFIISKELQSTKEDF